MFLQLPVPVVQQQTSWQINLENQLPSIITSMATLLGVAISGYVAVKNIVKQQAKSADNVAETLREANKVSGQRLTILQNTADDTHKLVNNNMAIQLKINAISARTLANYTKDPEHLRLADEADAALVEHMRKQVAVDKVIKDRRDAQDDMITSDPESKNH